MAIDLSVATIKNRAKSAFFEKIGGYALYGMGIGGVFAALMGWLVINDYKDRFSFNEVQATVVEVQPYCKLSKLKLSGDSKGIKSSDHMPCDEAYALKKTPEFERHTVLKRANYFFAYTTTEGLSAEAEISKRDYGSGDLAVGDTAVLLVNPENADDAISPNKPIFGAGVKLAGGGGLLLFLLSLVLWRSVRNRY
jgi:hypothetical protein